MSDVTHTDDLAPKEVPTPGPGAGESTAAVHSTIETAPPAPRTEPADRADTAISPAPADAARTIEGAEDLDDDQDSEDLTQPRNPTLPGASPVPTVIPSGNMESPDTLVAGPPDEVVAGATVTDPDTAPVAVSGLPTQRPEALSRRPSSTKGSVPDESFPPEVSPFAGLLAEAAENRPGKPTATIAKSTIGAPPSTGYAHLVGRSSPGDTMPPGYDQKRKSQETFNIEGRGRSRSGGAERSSPPSSDELAPPARTLGHYRILGELGSGGMAVVYKAVQPTLDRLVAIKELRHEFVRDKQVLTRFEREATSLATLQHGNIVHIYDFVRDFDGAFIAMEYVEGIDLFDVLAQTEILPSDVAAVIALQVAFALEYAHYRGIIHRDVKPSNVLISKIGEVKIMDFGIARDPGRADITQIGMALGTPAYMAPEQIRADRVDFRADIFSFGILLYEMLTGHVPWKDDGGHSVARKILTEAPIPPREFNPDLPAPLEAIIFRCLQKEPDDRYATTYDLRRDLERFVAQEVMIDPRQRLVVFLRNRKMITEAEASTFVDSAVRNDADLMRKDLCWPAPPAEALLRRVFVACALALAGVFAAAFLGQMASLGDRLGSKPRKLAPVVQTEIP